MPSSGKSQWMLQYMNDLSLETKIIYITPFLTETERIRDHCKKRKFQLPDGRMGQGSKLNHFKELLKQGKNISSTHSLFSSIDDEVIDLIRDGNYILVLDEVMNVVSQLDIFKDDEDIPDEQKEYVVKKDMEILMDYGSISVDRNFKVNWNENKGVLHRYETLKQLIDKDQVYFVSNSYLFWMFPHEIFESIFKEIFVLTYQFDYQIQAYYFKFFDIPYEKFGITKHREDKRFRYEFELVDYSDYLDYDFKKRKEIKELITICESSKLNALGSVATEDTGTSVLLSKSDYDKRSDKGLMEINRKAVSYLKYYLDEKSTTMMWTTYKDYKGKIKNNRFPEKHFVALNSRATNEYRDKSGVIYLVNRFINPYYNNLFRNKNILVDQDAYALAEMLQFLFRSQIRDDKPINVFIPSERMRGLLIKWLNGEY